MRVRAEKLRSGDVILDGPPWAEEGQVSGLRYVGHGVQQVEVSIREGEGVRIRYLDAAADWVFEVRRREGG